MTGYADLVAKINKERDGLRAEFASLVGDVITETVAKGEGTETTISSSLSAEQIEKHAKLSARWDQTTKELEVLASKQDKDRISGEMVSLYGDTAVSAQAKVSAKAISDLVEVGRNQYTAKRVPVQGGPGTLELPVPVISMGEDGRNRVQPYPALFSKENDGKFDLEATERHVEMVMAGAVGKYSPYTGKAVEAASEPGKNTLPDSDNTGEPLQDRYGSKYGPSIPTLSFDLYRYLLESSVILQYVTIMQTENPSAIVPIQRKTAVPEAVVMGNRNDLGQNAKFPEDVFEVDSVSIGMLKFGFMTTYTYELQRSITPWDFAQEVAKDGGGALGEAAGKFAMIGDGGNTQPEGIYHVANTVSGQSVTGTANIDTAFVPDEEAFNRYEFLKLFKALQPAVHNAGNIRLLTNFATFVDMLGVQNPVGASAFFGSDGYWSRSNIVQDEYFPAKADASTLMIMGDLSAHTVRFSGGPRIDYSTEYGFDRDALAYRFAHYFDAKQIDPNKLRGYKLAAK